MLLGEKYTGAYDDDELEIDEDDMVEILREFQKKREEKLNNAEVVGNPRNQKRSNFETEDQKKERVKKEEKKFWKDMTTVLSERKLRVWHALEGALTKYYKLLMTRKNLIEDTGTLNQQG